MSFLYPGWLLLLLILPLIFLGALLTQRGRSKAWASMVAPRLRKQLVKESSNTRRWISLALALLGCALVIATVARPYKGETTITEQISTRNILIAFDTSRSMLVEDATPNRMGNAKAMALELLQAFPHDRVGVIAFSGVPVLMSPLTIDHSSVHETISQLDTQVIPSGGSDIASAVQLAINTFDKSGHKSCALIVISDGEDHTQRIGLAGSEIRNAGIAVCSIGIGNENGGIIPDSSRVDGKFRDIHGHTVHSRLNPDALQQLATSGGGIYVPAESGAENAIRSSLSFLKSDRQEGRSITIPTEIYQWFLLPAIALLILSVLVRSNMFISKTLTPSPTAALLAISILLAHHSPARAANYLEVAETAYNQKDYETALEFFSEALSTAQGEKRRVIQFSQGSSAYRLKQWDDATRFFSRALLTENKPLQSESHYNLGNSLFQSGWTSLNPPKSDSANPFLELMRKMFSQQQAQNQPKQLTKNELKQIITNWQDALTHYRASLAIRPGHEDARHNHDEVKKLLELLQQAINQAKREAEQSSGQDHQSEQGKGKQPDNNQNNGDSNDPKQDPNQNGNNESPNNPDQREQGDQPDNNETNSPEKTSKPNQNETMERRQNESEEAFAARILKDHSDAETRPVNRRLLRIRRPAKDW